MYNTLPTILTIIISAPQSSGAWIALCACTLLLIAIFATASLKSAVDNISEAEARILHNRKSEHEQLIYKFYKRKEKVKASLSAMETFLAIGFVLCVSSIVTFGIGILPQSTAIIQCIPPCNTEFVCFFVATAFAIVCAAIIPGRLLSENRKKKIIIKWGWLVDTITTIAGSISFLKFYSSRRDDCTSSQLSVSIGTSPAQIGEKDIIRNILQFGDIQVREIMTPRHDIVAVDNSAKFSVLKNKIIESNFSRIPVFEENTDNIFGIIYVKDLIRYNSRGDDFDWTRLVRRIKYVSENKKISDLLREFQQKKTHMAAVCDEYGGISGLITMQDILEKIVGEINDEFDNDSIDKMLHKVNDNYYVADGRITIDDFCRELHLESNYFDEAKGDAESLAGVLLEMRGEFPQPGEKIKFRSLTMSVEAFSGRRIEKIGVNIE